MKLKDSTPLTRRLLTGLVICTLVVVALAVAGGVAFSGVLWYRDQVDEMTKTHQETAGALQKRLEETERQLRDAQQRLDESSAESEDLQKQVDGLKKQLEAKQKELDAARAQAGGKPPPVYPPGTKLVALTFDDGPGKSTTPRLLDEMKKRDVKATFFVLGRNAAKYPDLLKRMDAQGHVIASHTWSHKNLTAISQAEMKEELRKCADVIQSAVGYGPSLLRAPGGNLDNRLLAYCRENGLPLAGWTVDTKDWQSRSKPAILAAAFQKGAYGIHDGAIVLMHDVYESTVDAAAEMMDRLKSEGYVMVTVPELLRARAGGMIAGRMYYSDVRFKDAV